MKLLTPAALETFFIELCHDFDLRIPVIAPGGSRVLGRPGEGRSALVGGALLAKPTAVFFPQDGEIFTVGPVNPQPSDSVAKQLLVVGFTPRDLLCLGFIDRFFADGLRDDLYFRRREGAVIAAVSGFAGSDGAFVPISDGECDLEFVFNGTEWIVVPYSQAGRRITDGISSEAPADALAAVIKRSAKHLDKDAAIIIAASGLLLQDLVPDSFWEEIAASCILCTGCNLVCPTCTCFGMQDWRYPDRVERSRMWDSCQLDGFMREAGGHNPLGTEALRTRRRIHHKLAADKTKWGEISCFLCGRCDAVCPTGIGIVAVARRMVERFAV
jgi:sulfhydrogenase subunit beta (sulfur reductase)